ncbi:MAG TPA: type VI secretion system protein TssA [Polyangiaceae bacterium]|nr:type VI secretion system protein TssA [Polyangiaceae bacterium]
MFIDHQQLLQPVSPLDPAGPNLEYAPEFAELERTAHGSPDRQMGTSILAGQAPDAAAALELAVALLGRTKDLRIAVYLVRALLTRDGLPGFLEGLSVLRALTEQFWSSLHPALDPGDDGQDSVRANVLAALATSEFELALRRAPLIASRAFGQISLDDIVRASSTASQQPAAMDCAHVAAAFREQDPVALAALSASLHTGREHVSALSACFLSQTVEPPDLAPLQRYFQRAIEAIATHGASPAPVFNTPSPSIHVDSPSNVASPKTAAGGIANRHDVIRALDEICAYYQTHEPSSPLPLLLQRCRRLATLDFFEIMKDLAPDALSRLELISGVSAA